MNVAVRPLLRAVGLVVASLAIAVLATLASVRAQAAEPRMTLRVGTFADNRPWEFHENGRLSGFDVDLAKALAARLDADVNFVEMPFAQLFAALAEGRIDAAICSITITPERRRQFDFTQPYYQTSQGVAAMKHSRLRAMEDLAGRRVGTEAGSSNEQWLAQNRARYGFGPVVPSEGLDAAVRQLRAGEIDAYVGDLPALLYRLLKQTDLAVMIRLPTDDQYAIALPLNSPLTPRVDAALSELKRDGTLAAIHQRWFGMKPEPNSPVTTVLPRP
ncbi:ABC transporter substrate-binding protein [Starkeya koreensis]|uniref:ABC transporter substrate-binding protein n=1 Tax=Ancylobacter koreensis TaxID=266121 RepID=A0ABT0DL82_9HYPH|nr:ABC transporter substrate-binding protein [Ancylobacter koreensis]MCK0208047.1 ABC transporter substrate-binding protein [Ancylobacter koreensis]